MESQGEGQKKLWSITTNVDEELYRKVEADAKSQERTMSNFVMIVLKRFYNGDTCQKAS